MADKTLGAGKLYIELEDENGNLNGSERYLAETPELTRAGSNERVEDYSSDGAIAEKDLDIATKTSRELKFSTKDISLENIALFAIGTVSTVTQTTTPVVDENVGKAKQGEYMQLGKSLNPTGVRGVTSVTIKVGVTTKTLTTDYTLDAASGRIFIVDGGSIANDDVVLASFTPVANTRQQLATDQLGAKFCALRFKADNTAGSNKDYYWPRVSLNPDGETSLKSRDNVQQLTFSAPINTRTGFAQEYVDGVPVAS